MYFYMKQIKNIMKTVLKDLETDLGLGALLFITFAVVSWLIGVLTIISKLIIW